METHPKYEKLLKDLLSKLDETEVEKYKRPPAKRFPAYGDLKAMIISHKSKNHGMSLKDRKQMETCETFLNFSDVYSLVNEGELKDLDIQEIKNVLEKNKEEFETFAPFYQIGLRLLFHRFVKGFYVHSARVVLILMKVNLEKIVKQGKFLYLDDDDFAAYVAVLDFEIRRAELEYFQELSETSKNDRDDKLVAEILMGFKDHREMYSFPSSIKSFEEADALGKKIIEYYSKLEEDYKDYKKNWDQLNILLIHEGIYDDFKPNKSLLNKSRVYSSLAMRAQGKLKYKLLKKACEFHKEMRAGIPGDDFQQMFDNEAEYVELLMLISDYLLNFGSKIEFELLVKKIIESDSTDFVRLFSEGYQGLPEISLRLGIKNLSNLYMLNKLVHRNISLNEKYSKLIAKVLKKRRDLIEICKQQFEQPELPWNLSQSEKKLAEAIKNFRFGIRLRNLKICAIM
jgi:hypothetical protein